MALTDFEKTCLLECQVYLNRAASRGKSKDQAIADLTTIATGTEDERRAIVVAYVTDISIPKTDGNIAALDVEKIRLDALKIELAAYIV